MIGFLLYTVDNKKFIVTQARLQKQVISYSNEVCKFVEEIILVDREYTTVGNIEDPVPVICCLSSFFGVSFLPFVLLSSSWNWDLSNGSPIVTGPTKLLPFNGCCGEKHFRSRDYQVCTEKQISIIKSIKHLMKYPWERSPMYSNINRYLVVRVFFGKLKNYLPADRWRVNKKCCLPFIDIVVVFHSGQRSDD